MVNQFTPNRREVLQLMGLTAIAGGLVACSSSKTGSGAPSGGSTGTAGGSTTSNSSIDFGTNGDANNINPILAVDSDGYWRTDLMFDPLVFVDPKSLQPTPNLAKSWKVSPDGKTYTFNLDPRAKFWDGTPLTAADVEFTVMAMLAKNYTGPFQTYWARLAGADDVISGKATTMSGLRVIDDHTISMTVTEPYAGFLTVIARNLKPLPSHLLKGQGPLTTSSSFSHNPVGSGPYKFKSWVPGTSFEVVKNDTYWGTKATMGQITQTIIPDMNTLSQGVQSGQFDATIVAPQSSLPTLAKDSQLKIYNVPAQSGEAWWLNQRQAPWKGNVKLRQAMACAVDFITFQKKFMYIKDPVPATFYEYASWAYDAKAGAVPTYDPDKAKTLLAQAGYAHGNGLTIEIITNAGNDYRMQEEIYIQAAMDQLGVKVSVKQAEWGTFIAGVTGGHYDTAVVSTQTAIPDPTAFDAAVVTKGAVNYSGYSNPQVDSLLAQAGAILDQAKRKPLYSQIQTILAAELPYIPTAWYPNTLVIDKKYGNVDPSVIGPMWNVGSLTES
jgi:peptide/nickel transport system substrate-binding protein